MIRYALTDSLPATMRGLTLAHVLLAAALAAGNELLQFDFGVPGSVIGEQIRWQWIDSARWQVVAVAGMCKMAGA